LTSCDNLEDNLGNRAASEGALSSGIPAWETSWLLRQVCMFSRVLFLTLAFAISNAGTAQDSPTVPLEGLPATAIPSSNSILTIFKRVDEVNLVLSATDHHGHFVRDLNPSDLAISDNGEPPAKITYFERRTGLPLRVAVLIDTSDSVGYRFAFELKSAREFLKKVLRPNDDAALIVGFNQKPYLVQPLTSDISRLSHALHTLKPKGETALYDAIALASNQLRMAPESDPVRRVIVIVTDGVDNSSHINLNQAVEQALRAESVIYIMNIQDQPVTQEDRVGNRVIQQLAAASGGRVLKGHENGDMARSFRKIEEELRSQYALGYRPRQLIANFFFRPVRILGPKGIRIRCREGYYPQ
jgi:Ca-activated chloride channel homolog